MPTDNKKNTGWIWKLSKDDIIIELENRGVTFNASDTRDHLRSLLVQNVRDEPQETAETERKFFEDIIDTIIDQAVNISETKVIESVNNNSESQVNNILQEISNEQRYDLDDEMSDNNTKITFCLGKDKWSTFVERMEFQFLSRDVTEDKKKAAMLLTAMNEEAFELIKDLSSPTKLSEKKYCELTELMTNHLDPKPSEVMERNKFYKAQQEQEENIADFAARLKKLAANCNFTDLKTALRDQLVCGLRDHETKVNLFKMESLNYDTALKEAIARETAMINASKASTQDKKKEVFAIESSRSNSKYQNNRPSQKNKQYERPSIPHHQTNSERKPAVVCWNCSGRGHTRTQCPSPTQVIQQDKCASCGVSGHKRIQCKFREATCNGCQKTGHIESACYSKRTQTKKRLQLIEQEDEGDAENSPADEQTASTLNYIHRRDFYSIGVEDTTCKLSKKIVSGDRDDGEPMFVSVNVNGVDLSMEIDTGTYATVISERILNENFKNAKIVSTGINLRGYDGRAMQPIGKLSNLTVEFNGKICILECYILSGTSPALIGRQWLSAFGCWPLRLDKSDDNAIYKIERNKLVDYFSRKYAELFSDTPGSYNKSKSKIFLKKDAKPVAIKCRHVAHAIKPLIEAEIERLISLGYLEPVQVSEWATPIVPVFKSNGKIRICGDFKITVNPQLVPDKYPLHTIDDIFSVLQRGQKFTELDLTHAYMQFPIDEKCREPLTIVTHKGLFRYKSIPEGIAPAPADVQRKMDECLAGIDGVIAYIDNIYVTGTTSEEHMENLEKVFARLQECGLRINIEKCHFMQEKLEVLGFVIDKEGMHKSQSKVDAMVNAPRPENVKELESFLGLVTFYARFLENRSEKLKPLYDLVHGGNFVWDDKCDDALDWLKQELISPRVLAHYDPNEQIVLACDASNHGLSAILSHRYKDGSEKPIAYASRTIPKKELSRTILDKEAMAIVFGFKRFKDFIFGKLIILRTDNQSLKLILGPRKGIPETADNRFQRWAYYLSGFRFKIEHISSKANANCDALSRLPVREEVDLTELESDFSNVYFFEDGIKTFDSKMLAAESLRDAVIGKVIKYTTSEWPNLRELSDELRQYHRKRLELSVDKGCLFWGLRAVIPSNMRPLILRELHASHLGIVKVRMFARSYVWWPGIDDDIEFTVNNCDVCVIERKKPRRTPLTTWPWPNHVWSRIHCDFLKLYGNMYLLIIDAHSKWPEIINFKNNTKTYKVIEEFKSLFARFGLPLHVVSDGGPQFRTEFVNFLRRNSINHSYSPPYHPATNGVAENFVETFKDKVTKIVKGGGTLDSAVNIFLMDYRSIEHCTTGKSPYQLMFKRDMRTRFDMLKPNVFEKVQKSQRAQIVASGGDRQLDLVQGDTVYINDYSVRSEKRVKGEIVKQCAPSTFIVRDAKNVTHKRHKDQIVETAQLRRSPRLNKN